ncbi:MAG: hypothetical protein E7582_03565 [Ruminococcaceae bacterium]|nr:hypothetical protein [Oscillospiraceae bacterium]
MGQDNLENSQTAESSTINESGRRPARRQTFTGLYRTFRRSGLGKIDSAFNALYICQTNRCCRENLNSNNVGDGFFSHPTGYYSSKAESIRRAAKTRTLSFLERVAKILSPLTRSVEKKGNSPVIFDNSEACLKKALCLLKRSSKAVCVTAAALLFAISIYINSQKNTVVEVKIDGVVIGEVKSLETVDTALDRVNAKISSLMGEVFTFPHEVSFTIKNKNSSDCMDIDSVCDVLYTYTEEYITTAYGLYVDSHLIAVLNSRDDIVSVLDTVKSEHMALTGEDEDIANNIEIKYQEYAKNSIIDKETLVSMFSVVPEKKEDNARVDALLSSNENVSFTLGGEIVPLGQRLAEAVSGEEGQNTIVLDFVTYEEVTLRETVPFETEYITDDTYYTSQKVVQRSGKNGKASNTYRVKYVNGVEDSRVLINSTTIQEGRSCIIKVGTRILPETMTLDENDGKYMINPVPLAYVSDYFGWRTLNGRRTYHQGLDLAAMKGTPIYAAASGEVILASYSSSYGYVVKIEHADGLVTVYAHSSKLLVKVGDVVEQGEEIARVGSTGYSFGYHCHFEVIKDGEKVDPEDYIYTLE